MTTKFDHELHIHLFGCLTAEDVWFLGRDRWKKAEERLQWYESEYEKAWGRRPNSNAYWANSSNGFDQLRADFEFKSNAPFSAFQACFNLMIALFKLAPGEHHVLDHILRRYVALGRKYAEFRTIIPPYFTTGELFQYMSQQAQLIRTAEAAAGGTFEPRLVYSLPRDPEQCLVQYAHLRRWMRENPDDAQAIAGIDFSYFEEGYPPVDKRDFFAQVRRDNRADPNQALAILYHVGESFEHLSIPSAARWVFEAHAYGAHRLGHAIALGIDPVARIGKTVYESKSERIYHLNWLMANQPWLEERGYSQRASDLMVEIRQLEALPAETDRIDVTIDNDDVADIRQFQDALMAELASKGVVIESCPTSNFRIGGISDPLHHPLKRFVASGLRMIIATDDPGIFDVSLESEVQLASDLVGVPISELGGIARDQVNLRSRALATRGGDPTGSS
jgi:hypothetical protein